MIVADARGKRPN